LLAIEQIIVQLKGSVRMCGDTGRVCPTLYDAILRPPMETRIAILVCLVAVLVSTTLSASAFPNRVHFQGWVESPSGNPLDGEFDMRLRYFDSGGSGELLVETREGFRVRSGHLDMILGEGRIADGAGPVSYRTLGEMFASHAEVQLEVAIEGRVYQPRVRILPAGHSLESRLVLAGTRTLDDGEPHWKHYREPGTGSAVEAVTLRPEQEAGGGTLAAGRRPFLLDMEGPVLSLPVRELPVARDVAAPVRDAQEVNPPRHETLFDKDGYRYGTRTERLEDPLAIASAVRLPTLTTPAPSVSFEGIDNINGVLPPDPEAAVGPNHYIQMVNLSFAVFDKAGTLLTGPLNTNTLWTGFGGACENDNDGDAVALYDQQAGRWVLTQFAVSSSNTVCFAASTTSDPTGTYYLYKLDAQRFPDYFKLGVWPDPTHNAYFMGTNSGSQNQYDVYAIDRASLLAGVSPRAAQYFQGFPNFMMPADHDGPLVPPAGTPGIFYTFRDGGEPYFGSPPGDSIDLYEFAVDWTTPANSTMVLTRGFTPPEITDFNWTVCGFFVNCLPQPSTATLLDSASWWPMQRLQYRNFGTHETLVGNWTVGIGAGQAAPRWFELRRASGASDWSVQQEGTHAPDGLNRWMGSIAMDGSGNIALGYSVGSSALYPSIRFATRLAEDPPGTLQAETSLMDGGGSQTISAGRWGDYSSLELDPTDDCTFWYTTEYLAATSGALWRTRVGAFKLDECGVPTFALDVSPQSLAACKGSDAQYTVTVTAVGGFSDPVGLVVSGNPAGTTGDFDTNPLIPTESTLLTVSNTAVAAAGSYDLDVDASSGSLSQNDTVRLELVASVPSAPALVDPPDGATNVDLIPTLQWSGVPGATSYAVEIATDPGFATVVDSATVSATSYTPAAPLQALTPYFWRVFPINTCGIGTVSTTFDFTTASAICSTPGLNIPDGDPPGVSDTLSAVGGILTDLDLSISATHTWVGDLVFTLTHVDTSTSVTVVDRPGVPDTTYGCDGDNIDATLDDEAASPVETECAAGIPAIEGAFTPNNPLDAFDGEDLSGEWRLAVSDHVQADPGVLQAWCLLPTAPVSGADLAVSKTDGKASALAGTATAYTVTVTNQGPEAVLGASVSDAFHPALEDPVWTCTATGGASCSAGSVAGDISDAVNLPASGSVSYQVAARIAEQAAGTLSNTVAVSSPVSDPNPGNNSATDDTLLLCGGTNETLAGLTLVSGDAATCDVPGQITVGPGTLLEAGSSLHLIASGIGLQGSVQIRAGAGLSVTPQ
jgi:uncharacterized repeat protein (TIGR01451 family)